MSLYNVTSCPQEEVDGHINLGVILGCHPWVSSFGVIHLRLSLGAEASPSIRLAWLASGV